MSLRCCVAFHVLAKAVGALLLPVFLMLSAPGAQAMRLGGDERPVVDHMAVDGVGRLECLMPGGRARMRDATGWIVGNTDTVVTAAHTLFAGAEAIDPQRCVFRLLHRDGSIRETARIRYVRSPWSDPRHRGDSAHDVAVLKLDRPMRGRAITPVGAGRGRTAQSVELISLPGDATDPRARISEGKVTPFPLGAVRDDRSGLHVSDPSMLFASSADSAAGSSGGIYFAQGSGAAIGLHVGYVCGGPDGCFNFGLRFDSRLLSMIAVVAVDDDRVADTRLASAALSRGLR